VIWDKLIAYFYANNTNPDLNEYSEIAWVILREYDDSIVSSFVIDVTRNSTLWKDDVSYSSTIDVRSENGTWIYSCGNITDSDYNLTVYDVDSISVTWGEVSAPPSTTTEIILLPVGLILGVVFTLCISIYLFSRRET